MKCNQSNTDETAAPKNDWTPENQKAVADIIEAETGVPVSNVKQDNRWWLSDFDRACSFFDPYLFVRVVERIVRELGHLHIRLYVSVTWTWRDVTYRDKTFRASHFLARFSFGSAATNTLTESFAEDPDEMECICRKRNPLVPIQSLFCLREAFGLPQFSSYQWNRDGFVIHCDSKAHLSRIKPKIEAFFSPDAESITSDGDEITVVLRDYPPA